MPPNISGLRPFRKGVSGNPGGRPKKLPVTDVILQKLDEKCKQDKQGRTWAELLVVALLGRAIKGDVKAIAELIDRAEGKAKQRSELSGPDGASISFEIPDTREALERRIAELLGTPITSTTTQPGSPARSTKK